MKAVILADGRKPEGDRFRHSLSEGSLFIAADGGANWAREQRLIPDLIVGDLDSYQPVPEEMDRVIHLLDQETNDMEKALGLALEKGATEAEIFGALGGRPDHSLKNLSVLKRYNDQFSGKLKIIDPHGELWLMPRFCRLNLPVGTGLSLYPLSGRVEGITTRGLKYPLSSEALEVGVRDGTSNVTSEPEVIITHKSGDLLLMILNTA